MSVILSSTVIALFHFAFTLGFLGSGGLAYNSSSASCEPDGTVSEGRAML